VILLADLETPSSFRRSSAGNAIYRRNGQPAYRAATAGVRVERQVPSEDPYGRTTKVSGSLEASFQYAGYYQHAPSGLNFTLYRAFDTNSGRWLSRDPLSERVGLNLYRYCDDNALSNADPLGLITISIGIGGGGSGGGGAGMLSTDVNIGYSWADGWTGSLTVTGGLGVGTGKAAGYAANITATDANSTDDLNAGGYNTGGSAGDDEAAVGGGGVGGSSYSGAYLSLGQGLGTPYESHGLATYTITLARNQATTAQVLALAYTGLKEILGISQDEGSCPPATSGGGAGGSW
jgi:RHS repeat-associated protein